MEGVVKAAVITAIGAVLSAAIYQLPLVIHRLNERQVADCTDWDSKVYSLPQDAQSWAKDLTDRLTAVRTLPVNVRTSLASGATTDIHVWWCKDKTDSGPRWSATTYPYQNTGYTNLLKDFPEARPIGFIGTAGVLWYLKPDWSK